MRTTKKASKCISKGKLLNKFNQNYNIIIKNRKKTKEREYQRIESL